MPAAPATDRRPRPLSVIVPACNEAGRIGPCLDALLASDYTREDRARDVEVIVVANGCTDATAAEARARSARAERRGWRLEVMETGPLGKLGALNAGDRAAARGATRVYLDADVIVSPHLLEALDGALARDHARYASGQVHIPEAKTWVTRQYARFYWQVPFMVHGVPGCGIFAVNAAGRARWDDWPDIISDDTFARLQFTPGERVGVAPSYDWPLVEGWPRLVRVRQRQNAGVREIAERFPELLENDDKPQTSFEDKLRLALSDPVGALVYGGVALHVKLREALGLGGNNRWARGR